MKRLVFLALLMFVAVACLAAEKKKDERHVFPALGIVAERKVDVPWNRFYDHAGLSDILKKLQEAFPKLTRLYSVGQSVEGRELWCLEVTAKEVGDVKRKPGMYIDGNIHGK